MFSGQLKKGDSYDSFGNASMSASWIFPGLTMTCIIYHTVHLYDDRKKERYSDLLELQFL